MDLNFLYTFQMGGNCRGTHAVCLGSSCALIPEYTAASIGEETPIIFWFARATIKGYTFMTSNFHSRMQKMYIMDVFCNRIPPRKSWFLPVESVCLCSPFIKKLLLIAPICDWNCYKLSVLSV